MILFSAGVLPTGGFLFFDLVGFSMPKPSSKKNAGKARSWGAFFKGWISPIASQGEPVLPREQSARVRKPVPVEWEKKTELGVAMDIRLQALKKNPMALVEGLNVKSNAPFMRFCSARFPSRRPEEVAGELLQRVLVEKKRSFFEARRVLIRRLYRLLAESKSLDEIELREKEMFNRLLADLVTPRSK